MVGGGLHISTSHPGDLHGGNQHSTWTLRDPVLVVVVTQHPAGLP